ncbi:DUF6000 family protein [Nonomuraea endophytica]|uniref:DUF6000 family protein n=1 Tax=Nonomuraea endophytica TaxID=714136 RepID=UPI0037CA01A4
MGSFVLMPDRKVVRFGRSLAKHARRISDEDLEFLLGFEWRSRLTASWLIGLDQRTRFRHRLGALLEEGDGNAGIGYCLALALFGEEQDADILSVYLERLRPEPLWKHNQRDALSALMHLDDALGTNRAARHLSPGLEQLDLGHGKEFMDVLCGFAVACRTDAFGEWLLRKRQFVDKIY